MTFKLLRSLLLGSCALLMTSGALAQESALAAAMDTATDLGVAIERDAVELEKLLRPDRPDIDSTDTLVVFTNRTSGRRVAACVAYNHNGIALGRGHVVIPGNGLRFLRSSDLADGRDFIGHVRCKARGPVTASAFLVAPGGISDMPVKQRRRGLVRHVEVPVVASF